MSQQNSASPIYRHRIYNQSKDKHPRGLVPLALCYAIFFCTFIYLVSALYLYLQSELPQLSAHFAHVSITLLKALVTRPSYSLPCYGYFQPSEAQ